MKGAHVKDLSQGSFLLGRTKGGILLWGYEMLLFIRIEFIVGHGWFFLRKLSLGKNLPTKAKRRSVSR